MKKLLISLTILAIAATAAFVAVADDAAVYSANTIGVIKYTVPPAGGLICVSLPLEPMQGTETKWGDTSIADQLLPSSKVFFWTGSSWQGFTKSTSGKWTAAASNRVVQVGEAVFLQSPASQTDDHVIAFVGELPDDEELTYSINGDKNLVPRGVTAYPVSGKFGDSELAAKLPSSSKVFFWTGSSWQGFTKSTSGKWTAAAQNKEYEVGQGVFIEDAGASTIITNSIPYDL